MFYVFTHDTVIRVHDGRRRKNSENFSTGIFHVDFAQRMFEHELHRRVQIHTGREQRRIRDTVGDEQNRFAAFGRDDVAKDQVPV